MIAAQLAALAGIETDDDLLKMVTELESNVLVTLAEDLPYAQTSSILALVSNPAELFAHVGVDPNQIQHELDRGRKDGIKIVLAATTMVMQELDKRIPPRMTRDLKGSTAKPEI